MTIRCVVIDDKPLALTLLEEYISRVDFLQIVYKTTNPLKAVDYIRHNEADLLFVDIQMPELSGLDILKLTRNICSAILVTAYADYALDGYEHDVIDYLLKPVAFERFYRAVLKVQKLKMGPAIAIKNIDPHMTKSIFVKAERKIINIQYVSILYIEGMQNYIVIHTLEGRIISHTTMKEIAGRLPCIDFVRIHKSFIIAKDKINLIKGSSVIINGKHLPIGPSYKEDFYKSIQPL